MTHKLTHTALIDIKKNHAMHCYRDNGMKCHPLTCIGAEVIPKPETEIYAEGSGFAEREAINPHRKIIFHCLPQPREIILSEEK